MRYTSEQSNKFSYINNIVQAIWCKSSLIFGFRRVSQRPELLILVQGEWIRKLGFNVEDYVIISEKKGQLIINLETE